MLLPHNAHLAVTHTVSTPLQLCTWGAVSLTSTLIWNHQYFHEGYWTFYTQSTAKGHRMKENTFLARMNILIHYSTHCTAEDGRHWEKMKCNKVGRQKESRSSPCKKHSMQALVWPTSRLARGTLRGQEGPYLCLRSPERRGQDISSPRCWSGQWALTPYLQEENWSLAQNHFISQEIQTSHTLQATWIEQKRVAHISITHTLKWQNWTLNINQKEMPPPCSKQKKEKHENNERKS